MSAEVDLEALPDAVWDMAELKNTAGMEDEEDDDDEEGEEEEDCHGDEEEEHEDMDDE